MSRMIPNAALLAQLNWRYATKKFDSTRQISPDDWQTLEKALILAPASYGLQPFSYIVVQNAEVRTKLRAASWKQSQVTDASHYIVLTIKEKLTEADVQKFMDRMVSVREVPAQKLEGYKSIIIGDVVNGPRSAMQAEWMARQLYIALGQIMTCAAMMGIDTCAMEGIDPAQYDEILGLKKFGVTTKCGLALGYRHSEDGSASLKKVRLEKKDLFQYI